MPHSDSQAHYPGAVYRLDVPLNHAKLQNPYAIPPFSQQIFFHVGMIGLNWGVYEGHFTRLLTALLLATGDDSEPGWRFLDYRRRRKLCRKNIVGLFRMRRRLADYLTRILDDSAQIHNDRNAILHGKVAARLTAMPDATAKCELVTESRINGKPVKTIYSADDLETISHRVLHLIGRLNLSFQVQAPGLAWPDMQALEGLLSQVPMDTRLP